MLHDSKHYTDNVLASTWTWPDRPDSFDHQATVVLPGSIVVVRSNGKLALVLRTYQDMVLVLSQIGCLDLFYNTGLEPYGKCFARDSD